jgi:protein SCO1
MRITPDTFPGPRTIKAVATVALFFGLVASPVLADRSEPLPKQLENVGVTEHPGARLPLQLEFTDENGTTVRLGQYFSGKRPVILTLNYFRCPMLCGLQLTGLADGLKGLDWTAGKQFEIVTLSFDPLDTPALAKAKKATYIADYGRAGAAQGWHFLTGTQSNIKAVADAVGFRYQYLPEQKQYAHPAAIFLASPDGHEARVLYGVEFPSKTLRLALLEASQGKVGTTTDQLLLYCFHYDASQGRYTLAAGRIMSLGGFATAMIVGVWLVTAWGKSRKHRSKAKGDET